MSGISRRSILGAAGGTAAAATTVLSSSATARAAEPHARTAETATVTVPDGTECKGETFTTFPDGVDDSEMTITFSVAQSNTPSDHQITAQDLANAISAFAQTKGWPAITFYGTPAPVAVN